ncbi:MAG: DUF1467 family protein [Rhodospirillaceae bacterium]|jgi:predicted secreted protein|nr:DUF1467 family protein [Rhodospirillaceae bacterium]MBT6136743.1 DUF1467 family protein [Rhodospirillaceae bacterium]
MNWVSGLVVYLLLWWWVFFMTLPFGVKRDENAEEGHEQGAPEKPMLWRKAAAATVIAGVLFVGVYYIVDSGIISFREMSLTLG